MKIDSKKIMIITVLVTAVLLLGILAYGILSGGGGDETTPETPQSATDPFSNVTTLGESTGTPTASEHPGDGTSDIKPPESHPDDTSDGQHPATTAYLEVDYLPVSGRVNQPTDLKIELIIDWKTLSRSNNSAVVQLDVKIQSYSLFVSARNNCTLEVMGKQYTFSTDPISYEGSKRTEFTVFSQTITMPLVGGKGSTAVKAVWPFRGEYASVSVDEITIEGFIEIKD